MVQSIPKGEDKAIGLTMVSVGLAQVYPKTTPKPPQSYKDAEDAAKQKKLGVWKSDNPIAPWDWRKKVREAK